jgi:hypothetical protein
VFAACSVPVGRTPDGISGGTEPGGEAEASTTLESEGSTSDAAGSSSSGDDGSSSEGPTGEGPCDAGSRRCTDGMPEVCDDDGQWNPLPACDELQGLQCELGHCVGACSSFELGHSYIGCDYYPTVTSNAVDDGFDFAVVVSNGNEESTTVTVTRGDETVATHEIDALSMRVIALPWIDALKWAYEESTVVEDGAYRVRADLPVSVYQYSPLQYTDGSAYSYSNDASLLLPVNAWGTEYVVVARNSFTITIGLTAPGFYAVVASEDDTTVELQPSPSSAGYVVPGPSIDEDGAATVTLDRGDVMQVFSTGVEFPNPNPVDLTGSRVVADKPVQVIGGHQCTFVPWDVWACDHLEENVPPLSALGGEYFATTPLVPPIDAEAFAKPRFVRIIATEADTMVAVDPDPGVQVVLGEAGDYVELGPTDLDFHIVADHKIVVAQYMTGQELEAGGNAGDPSMTISVPPQQFRQRYQFHAPGNYSRSYVNVVAPTGAVIDLDGVSVETLADTGWTPIGLSDHAVIRASLPSGFGGDHVIEGDRPFGIQVYGYGEYTSYWYPGGLDVEELEPPG